ncbi:putative membrane protein [Clostridioides difficile P1]|nr:putative membrane protein [Clostridioides difficile P1]
MPCILLIVPSIPLILLCISLIVPSIPLILLCISLIVPSIPLILPCILLILPCISCNNSNIFSSITITLLFYYYNII